MGLGSVNNNKGIFLSIAGGYIWDRKADKSNPNYATQEYEKANGEKGERQGARYADLTGTITGVQFKTHAQYGENINVNFDDEDGGKYIISISTNNRYSQDMMKALLKLDLKKEVFVKPYDFLDDSKKRVMGISFRQDGKKVDLKVDEAPNKDAEWFKNASKKQIKRFFEDLSDWFVAEVEEKICPLFVEDGGNQVEKKQERKNEVNETGEEQEDPKPTPLKMKKAIKAYIDENYAGKELPTLTKEELNEWYNLVLQEEELPFSDDNKEGEPNSEVDQSDLDNQLNSLLKK